MPNGLKEFFDRTFGSPDEALRTIRAASEAMATLDTAKLRLVRSVLESANRVKGSPEELQMVLEVLNLIARVDMEKLTAIKDITANLLKLAKFLPKEGLKQFPLKEIVEEIRKGN